MKSEIQADEGWVNNRWRPVLGWTYIAICLFDFILAPVINFIFFERVGAQFVEWSSLTMQSGGMFHIAMGVILGITSYTRGQEKISRYRYDSNPYDYEPGRHNYGSPYDQRNHQNNEYDRRFF